MDEIKSVPPGVELRGLSLRVFQVLAEHTEFPWPILQVQCKRKGIDPTAIMPEVLPALIDPLATSVQRFSSPANAEDVRRGLQALVRAYARPRE